MTVPKVEIGFSGPARATAFQLDNATYGLLDSGVLGIGVSLVDLTSRLVSISVGRGRERKTEPTSSGRATIVFDNRDGVLDPLNTASSLYPGVEPRRPVNIYADSVQVYAGFVDDIDLAYSPGGGAIVTVTASDGLSRLSLAEFPAAGLAVSSEDSGARITSVLASDADLWTGTTSIDSGDSTLAAGTAEGNVLAYLQDVERSEGGFFFVDREGALAFRNRNNPAQNPGSLTVSDAGGTACTPFTEIGRQAGVDDLYNRVTATYSGTVYAVDDEDSIDDYGLRTLDLGDSLLDSVAAVEDRLDYELARRAGALTSVRTVTVDQSATSSGCSATLQHDLGDSVKVIFSPPGVAQQTQTSAVVGLRHDFTIGTSWRTTLLLSPLDDAVFLVLDDTLYGKLDVGALAF